MARYSCLLLDLLEPCPSCGSPGHAIGTSLGATVLACNDCDLWFLSAEIRPQADTDNHWYAGMVDMTAEQVADLVGQMSGPYKAQLRHLSELTMGRDLLDVGCGVGMFLYEAREEWNSYGLEESAYGREFAQSRLGLCVKQTLDELPTSRFDVVRLSHVIEHIPAPREFMTWVSKLVFPGGILAVIVPNRESLVYWLVNRFVRLKHSTPALHTAIYPNMHVLGFSKRALINCVGPAGFELLSLKYVSMGNPVYYPLLYDGLLAKKKVTQIPRNTLLRYYLPLLLANVGNRIGLGEWIVAYFRKRTS